MFRQHQAGSIVSVTRSKKHPAWTYELTQEQLLEPVLPSLKISCRQDLPPTYVLNGTIYLASMKFLEKEKRLITNSTLGFVMPQGRPVGIDTHLDWQWGEFLMNQNQS